MSQIDYHNITASNAIYSNFNGMFSDYSYVGESMNGWMYPGIGSPWCGFPRGNLTPVPLPKILSTDNSVYKLVTRQTMSCNGTK